MTAAAAQRVVVLAGSSRERSSLAQAEEGGGHEGVEAPNPILPAPNEIVWGGLSFVLLFAVMARFAFPLVQRAMDERSARIQGDLDEATRARTEAETTLEGYKRQLADARSEAGRIIEEARQTADHLRRDLMERAEADVAEVKQRARDDVEAAKQRTLAELRGEVSTLALDLAEKVVGRNLDREANAALVDTFISQVGTNGSSR